MTKYFKSDFTPGIYSKLDEAAYRADGALSTSDYKLLAKTPHHFKSQTDGLLPWTDSPAMRLGRLFHCYALERERWDKTVVTCPEEFQDRRYKASKDWWEEASRNHVEVITQPDLNAVRSMFDAYSALKPVQAATLKPHRTEVSVFCQKLIGLNDMKCRVDFLGDGLVIDIKTTRAGGADPSEFTRTSKYLKYHWQQASYTRMLARHGLEVKTWIWAVVEKEPPYEAAAYTFSREDLDYAMAELKEADRKLLACQELDSWPSYTPNDAVELNLFLNGFKL